MDDCWTNDSLELPHDGQLTPFIDAERAELIPESLLNKLGIVKIYYDENFNSIFKHVKEKKTFAQVFSQPLRIGKANRNNTTAMPYQMGSLVTIQKSSQLSLTN